MLEKVGLPFRLLRHLANAMKAARQCRVDDHYDRRLNRPSTVSCNNPMRYILQER